MIIMKKRNTKKSKAKQLGLTLIEVMVALVIGAFLILGALALFAPASSSTTSSAALTDLTALRTLTQQWFYGQGNYGTTSLNANLISSLKVPSDMTTATPVINTSWGGTATVTGNTNNFTIALTNVPADLCSNLLTNAATGWSSVKVGSGTAITTFPVNPTIASSAANCGGTAPFTVTWTTVN